MVNGKFLICVLRSINHTEGEGIYSEVRVVYFDILESEVQKKSLWGRGCLSGFNILILFLCFNVFEMLNLILFGARH